MKRYACASLFLTLLWSVLVAAQGTSQDSALEQWRTYERDLKAWCAATAPSASESCVHEELQRKGFPPTVFDTLPPPQDAPSAREIQPVVPAAPQSSPRIEKALHDAYAARLRLCAAIGASANTLVLLRDGGVPLAAALQSQQDTLLKGPDPVPESVQQFLSAIALDIYNKSYWDATEARRQAETRCIPTVLR